MKIFTWVRVGLILATVLSLSVGGLGCKKPPKFIDKVHFIFSENLEVARVSLTFTDRIKSNFSAGFALKEYGYLFINPYTAAAPFELNTCSPAKRVRSCTP